MRINNKRYILIFIACIMFVVGAFIINKKFSESNDEADEIDNTEYPYKISVIIPVYNTEKYLDECLCSVENQTLKEIEIICVNDGSKDSSLEILKRHADKDSRIKIINQRNAGVSSARNTGIKAAQGKYISFFDSDDILLPYFLEKAYEDLTKYNVSVAAFKLQTFIDGEEINIDSFAYDDSKVKVCKRSKKQNPFYNMVENAGFIVTKVYKKSLITDNNIWFKEGITNYEDQLFNLLLFPHVTKMVQDDNVSYLYRKNRPGSAVTEFNAKKILTSSIAVSRELVDNFELFNSFEKGSYWLVTKIFDLNYNHIITDAQDENDKKYFAEKVVNLIENQLVKERGVVLKGWQKDNLNVLKKIMEN